jgi:hypothetical protein
MVMGSSAGVAPTATAQWLRAGGIRRVITGHKPAGDSPAICSSVCRNILADALFP